MNRSDLRSFGITSNDALQQRWSLIALRVIPVHATQTISVWNRPEDQAEWMRPTRKQYQFEVKNKPASRDAKKLFHYYHTTCEQCDVDVNVETLRQCSIIWLYKLYIYEIWSTYEFIINIPIVPEGLCENVIICPPVWIMPKVSSFTPARSKGVNGETVGVIQTKGKLWQSHTGPRDRFILIQTSCPYHVKLTRYCFLKLW